MRQGVLGMISGIDSNFDGTRAMRANRHTGSRSALEELHRIAYVGQWVCVR